MIINEGSRIIASIFKQQSINGPAKRSPSVSFVVRELYYIIEGRTRDGAYCYCLDSPPSPMDQSLGHGEFSRSHLWRIAGPDGGNFGRISVSVTGLPAARKPWLWETNCSFSNYTNSSKKQSNCHCYWLVDGASTGDSDLTTHIWRENGANEHVN